MENERECARGPERGRFSASFCRMPGCFSGATSGENENPAVRGPVSCPIGNSPHPTAFPGRNQQPRSESR